MTKPTTPEQNINYGLATAIKKITTLELSLNDIVARHQSIEACNKSLQELIQALIRRLDRIENE